MEKIVYALKKTATPLCIIVFIFSIIFLQSSYDQVAPPFTTKIKTARRDLLPAASLPYLNFGFSAILADMYWIRSVQDFIAWNGKETYYLDYFRNISTLDKRFEYPYLFAIVAIPQNKDTATLDKVAALADQGISDIPTSWKIPYYLGTQYFLFTKTYDKAGHYIKIAIERPGVPEAAYGIYSSFVTNNIKGFRASRELVKVIYNNTDSETIKRLAENSIRQEVIIQMLENAIVAYKVKFGTYPTSTEALAENKFAVLPEDFKAAFKVTINRYNGSFKIEAR